MVAAAQISSFGMRRPGVGLLVFLAALVLAFAPFAPGLLRGQLPYISDYISATLSLNYFQFGAIRRGLGPSIAYLLGPTPRVAFAVFYLCNLVLFAAVMAWVFSKIRASLPVLFAFAIVLADLVVFWRIDAGRTDILVASLLAFAAIAVSKGRLVAAVACACVGLFIHELSFIFGLPLITGLAFAWRRQHRWGRAQLVPAGVLIGLTLILFAGLGFLPHSPVAEIVATVRAELPKVRAVDAGLYYAFSGFRGLVAAQCVLRLEPNWGVHLVSGMLIFGLCTFALAGLRRSTWLVAAWAGLLPFVFMWSFTVDMSRWAAMSIAMVWLVCALQPERETARPPSLLALARIACAAGVFLLHYPHTTFAKLPLLSTSPLIDSLAFRTGISTYRHDDTTTEICDPGWESVLAP